MSNFTDATLTQAIDAVVSDITVCSLHSADPGVGGASELTGGTYAQQNVTFGTATAGQRNVNNAPTFDVPPSATVRYVGFWAGATFKVAVLVTEEVYSVNGGTYQVLNTTNLRIENTV